MALQRVRVIGGGPAGLFAARLLALDHPDWDVALCERLPPDDTFGFGVGLTGGLLDALEAADPAVHAAIAAAAFPFSGAGFDLPQGSVRLGQFHAGAVSRAKLLKLLLDLAVEAGVRVAIPVSGDAAALRAEADLVIAADGVSSATRELLREPLGVTESLGRGRFIWCGSETALDGTVFHPVTTPDGLFVAHAYPYADGRSTFVIETAAETLARAGCEQPSFSDDGASDDGALSYLSAAFRELLEGGAFVGNRSRWMQFRTVQCERWSEAGIVLLGDAKATAHPSMGSGTKLALEDAIALAAGLRGVEQIAPGHLEAFETGRRPGVARIQDRAQRSQLWWESFGERLHLTPARVAVAYLSRAGAVSLEDLIATAPELVTQAVAEWAQVEPAEVPARDLTDWVLHRPMAVPGPWNGSRLVPTAEVATDAGVITVRCGDPWGREAETLVLQARDLEHRGARVVTLDGPPSRESLLDRLAMGERLRNELRVPVGVVTAPDQLPDVADGIVAGRADLAIVNTA